jgi:hypothetical protein
MWLTQIMARWATDETQNRRKARRFDSVDPPFSGFHDRIRIGPALEILNQ